MVPPSLAILGQSCAPRVLWGDVFRALVAFSGKEYAEEGHAAGGASTHRLSHQDLEDTPAPQYPAIPPMTEYFFDGTRDVAIFPPPVSLEPVEVDLGACPGPEGPSPVPLCLMNHTKGKITVVWTRRSDCPFWVTPETCDVPPLKSTAMRLHFQPPHPNGLYAVELEAFAVYKVCAGRQDGEGRFSVPEPEWQAGVRGGDRGVP